MAKTSGASPTVANQFAGASRSTPLALWFLMAVFGFSFWFFMAVPFASHRESYWWLGMVHSQPFSEAFSLIASTYRPLAQAVSWSGFLALDPSIFPTSPIRQTILQGLVYALFVIAWWQVWSASKDKRATAIVGLVAGAVFFSGYVHLFHIYGFSYVPVMLVLGALLKFHASRDVDQRETSFAATAVVLALWHPFATGVFAGYFGGFYWETMSRRTVVQHFRALVILLVCVLMIAAVVLVFARSDTKVLDNRLAGFLVSYQTNEVNILASGVALLLALAALFGLNLRRSQLIPGFAVVIALGAMFLKAGLPVLLLWLGVVLVKLLVRREWALFSLALAVTLLPFGGGIGTPMYGLFAIIVGVFATPIGWSSRVEETLAAVRPVHLVSFFAVSMAVVLAIRAGYDVPVVSKVARPLLSERERTYQLESALSWLSASDYCAAEIAFTENSGNPVDSDNVVSRQNRPPAWIEDVQLFWNNVLRCGDGSNAVAVITFGGSAVPKAKEVFTIPGKHAEDAIVWIGGNHD